MYGGGEVRDELRAHYLSVPVTMSVSTLSLIVRSASVPGVSLEENHVKG
jgi:hypothetical protein